MTTTQGQGEVGKEAAAPAIRISWRSPIDGLRFSGAVVRELPEYHSVIARRDTDGRLVAVHEQNIDVLAGVVAPRAV
jgi:hypothetical protein